MVAAAVGLENAQKFSTHAGVGRIVEGKSTIAIWLR